MIKSKKVLSVLKPLLLIVGLIIIGVLAKKSGPAFIQTLSQMNVSLVLLALIPWSITLLLGTYRLKMFTKTKLTFFEMLKIYLYGYVLNYASAIQGLGAGAKIGMLKMKKVSIAKSSASVGSEIVYDVIFTLFVSVLFFIFHINAVLQDITQLLNPVLLTIAGIVIIGAIISLYMLRRNKHITEFLLHLKDLFKPRQFIKGFGLTFFIWLFPALMMVILFKAAGLDISILLTLSALSLAMILGLLSLIPGGLGVRDAITAYVYSLAGISIEVTITLALFMRLFTVGSVVVFAGIAKVYDKK